MINKNNMYFGIDFGTSNSTIGCYTDNKNFLIPLELEKSTIPSTVFFDFESKQRLFGQEGINEYLSGTEGRLMRSLKSILGTSLMSETTQIGDYKISFSEIIGSFLKELRTKIEFFSGKDVESIVLGRPVRFVDDDDQKDINAQNQLEAIAREQGFKNIEFQYEPIAAALNYKQTITKEEIALIIDIGGGTSDFSIIKLTPFSKENDEVLANSGIHIGGNDFDRNFSFLNVMPHLGLYTTIKPKNLNIPNHIFFDLSTWHKINLLYNKKTEKLIEDIFKNSNSPEIIKRLVKIIHERKGHELAINIENAKIKLTHTENTILNFDFIQKNFNIDLNIKQLNEAINDMIRDIFSKINNTIHEAKISVSDISTVFLTGGSTAITLFNEQVIAKFPQAKIVKGNVLGSVGLGLAIDAYRKFY